MKSPCFSVCARAACCAFAVQFPATAIAASNETVLHSFGSGTDGSQPFAELIEVNGALYGTTSRGGAYGYGTVFSINPTTGAETVVYSFCPDGYRCRDGSEPEANLINVKGTLYGTTYQGGADGIGTVFSIDPTTGSETVLHSFKFGDGAYPLAGLLDVNGTLYGTTDDGGKYGEGGTVFSIDPETGALAVLHSFGRGRDGAFCQAGLIDVGGALYGTTYEGGNIRECADGCGTVFSLDPKTGAETVLHAFDGTVWLDRKAGWETVPHAFDHKRKDGNNPQAGLTDVNGTLYGTTYFGGAHDDGTVFSFNPKTDKEKVLYSFRGADGALPAADLIDEKGTLYGTTRGGGSGSCDFSCGTVFSVSPTTGVETVVYSFLGGSDGEFPFAGAVDVKGRLYGTTLEGGAYGKGTVFAIRKP